MTEDSTYYSIVVLGAMNPRIHHASWYLETTLVTEAEREHAVNDKGTFCTPPLAHINFPEFNITCQEERWQIQTSKDTALDRICSVAGGIFGSLLPHTPINLVGMNFDERRSVPPTTFRIIAERLAEARLGFRAEHILAGEFIIRRDFSQFTNSLTVKPLKTSADQLLIASNFEHRLEEQRYSVQSVLNEHFENHRLWAVEETQSILNTISQ